MEKLVLTVAIIFFAFLFSLGIISATVAEVSVLKKCENGEEFFIESKKFQCVWINSDDWKGENNE